MGACGDARASGAAARDRTGRLQPRRPPCGTARPAVAAGSLLDALRDRRVTRHAAPLLDRLTRLARTIVQVVIAPVGRRALVCRAQPARHPAGASGDCRRNSRPPVRRPRRRPRATRSAAVASSRLPRSAIRRSWPALPTTIARAAVRIARARQGCPAAAVPVVIARAQDRTLDPSCRALAIRAPAAPAPAGARAFARARDAARTSSAGGNCGPSHRDAGGARRARRRWAAVSARGRCSPARPLRRPGDSRDGRRRKAKA